MSVSRREALTWLLGAPLALEACKASRGRPFAGQVRGGAHRVGHRLREATVEHARGPATRTRVAVVGAGPSGLCALWRLLALGVSDCLLFDLETQPGGTSAYGTDGVVPHPWGAHYVPLPATDNRALTALLREMGVLDAPGELGVRETTLVRAPEERLFIDGAWHHGLYPRFGASARDLEELSRFRADVTRWVARRDGRGRRAFELPAARCSDDAEFTALDRISAAEYLDRKGLSSPRLRWYVDYACRDDYGLTLAQTSAWAMLFYFASRVSAPHAPSAPFLTWPEGNGRIVRHLAHVAGPRLRLGALVTDVLPSEDRVELSVLDARNGGLRRYEADYVILATPKFVTARILRPWRERPPSFLAEFSYGAWMVANLHLRRRPHSVGAPIAWDSVLYDSPSLGYVSASHQVLADFGPTVWTYYRPLTDDDPRSARRKLLELDHATLCASIVQDLGRAHRDLADCIQRIDVWRWGHGMVRPIPGFFWSAGRRAASQPVGRVHLAHSDGSGLSLFEEAQYQGVRAAEAAVRAMGRSFSSLLG